MACDRWEITEVSEWAEAEFMIYEEDAGTEKLNWVSGNLISVYENWKGAGGPPLENSGS